MFDWWVDIRYHYHFFIVLTIERDRTIYSQFCPTVPHINFIRWKLVTSSNDCWFKATADRPSGIAHMYTYTFTLYPYRNRYVQNWVFIFRSHNALFSIVTIYSLASDCLRRTWNWKNKSTTLLTMMKSQKRTTHIPIRCFISLIKLSKELFSMKEIDWGGEVVKRKRASRGNGMFV